MKKIKMLAAGGVMLAASVLGLLAAPRAAMAVTCPPGSLRDGEAPTLAECNVEEPETPLMETVMNIIRLALAVLGLVAVAVIILGGVSYATSTGDAAKVAKAKNTIMYGVIGLVVALLAFAIVSFILTNVFNGGGSGDSDSSSDSSKSSLVIENIAG